MTPAAGGPGTQFRRTRSDRSRVVRRDIRHEKIQFRPGGTASVGGIRQGGPEQPANSGFRHQAQDNPIRDFELSHARNMETWRVTENLRIERGASLLVAYVEDEIGVIVHGLAIMGSDNTRLRTELCSSAVLPPRPSLEPDRPRSGAERGRSASNRERRGPKHHAGRPSRADRLGIIAMGGGPAAHSIGKSN